MSQQLSFFGSSLSEPYTVSQLTGHIGRLIDQDPQLRDVWLEAEVADFGRAASGHCYFTLRDAGAQIRCVMWRNHADLQDALPRDGDQVLSHGYVGVYEARGVYQLYVDQIRPAGVGALYEQFERLKAKLEREGLFAPERKRPVPLFPLRIGVVTSRTAAALRDVLNVLSRRFPLAEVVLSPTLVQGEAAPPQIVAAIEVLDQRADIDVIIVTRGGGSLEELWAFNDERVARAVAASGTPVVCGVGHETDFSLADFAADLRAPTPSAAAEMVVPDRKEIQNQVNERAMAVTAALQRVIDAHRWRLIEQLRALRHLSPVAQLAQARQRVDDLAARAERAISQELSVRQERVNGQRGQLAGVSPFATLERGYAVVRSQESGTVITSVLQVTSGHRLDVRVADGDFEAETV